jgi:hypothetical protein
MPMDKFQVPCDVGHKFLEVHGGLLQVASVNDDLDHLQEAETRFAETG